jgi:potassium uptake TrkH family protein
VKLFSNQTGDGSKLSFFVRKVPFALGLLSFMLFLYDHGFQQTDETLPLIKLVYLFTFAGQIVSISGRYLLPVNNAGIRFIFFDLLLIIFFSGIIILSEYFTGITDWNSIQGKVLVFFAIVLATIRELSSMNFNLKRKAINPAQLFIFSFLMIIATGSLLLMLPGATWTGISVIDALFTSASAVCVTGLVVVDTGSYFTGFGQAIILVLIQTGGIGIMTFASYFSYFFKGVSSFENQLVLKEMTNTEKIGEVFSVLKRIIMITFVVEGIGAVLIYQSLDHNLFLQESDQIFFAIFHAVSGFCNAGFSTLGDSLYDSSFRFNYPLHYVIALLIILGGLGFPVVINVYRYFKVKLLIQVSRILRKRSLPATPWLININTRIVLVTSMLLIMSGTIFIFIFEYNHALAEHSLYGKMVTAFFGSVSARTAGFNTVDIASLQIPALLVILFLMWVGASPGSTGGGIKTSSFAVAVLNIISIVRGKSRLEVYNREISVISVYRAFTVIILSIFVIGVSSFLLVLTDPDAGLLNITFETFSAYSTVGLSRGITASLGSSGKFILILTMFIGRVSMLTILIAAFKKVSSENYRLPSETILIN